MVSRMKIQMKLKIVLEVNKKNKKRKLNGQHLQQANPNAQKWMQHTLVELPLIKTPQGPNPLIKERLPKALTTCEFTVRTRWVGKFFTMGINTCARMLINLIREVDPTMTVIPKDSDESDDYITHENDFDSDRYTIWARAIPKSVLWLSI